MSTKNVLTSNILDSLGLQNLSAEKKTELLGQMTQVIQDRVTDRVVEQLSADERKQFDQVFDQSSSQEIDQFLRRAVPDFEQIMADEVARFQKEMTAEVDTLRAMVAKP